MSKHKRLKFSETRISLIHQNEIDYLILTDMTATFRESSDLNGKWITTKSTLEYLGVWEKINNADFNYPEFGVIGKDAGTKRFIMSVDQWVGRMKAVSVNVR